MNRIAEQVREQFSDVNKLISSVKKVFIKAPYRFRAFQQDLSNVPLPPEPILTRFGTWLSAAFYYQKHLDEISTIVRKFNSSDSTFIKVYIHIF